MWLVQTLELTQMFYKTRASMQFSSFVVELSRQKLNWSKNEVLWKTLTASPSEILVAAKQLNTAASRVEQ